MHAAMQANEAAPSLVLSIDMLLVYGVQIHSMSFLPPIDQKTLAVCL